MASTYTTNLRVEKPAYNEQSDTWGGTLDTGFDRFDACLGGAIYGLTLSTAGSSATFGIAIGGANGMSLASAYTKTTSSWAVGTATGALDTGAIANSTWYSVFLIERIDVSPTVTDVLISLSATAPTMPTNYTRKRRIGSMKTDGSAHWVSFTQIGDRFVWAANVSEITASALASATTQTLGGVPTGVKVLANIRGVVGDTAVPNLIRVASPVETTFVAGSWNAGVVSGGSPNDLSAFGCDVLTNTSGQVLVHLATYNATNQVWVVTTGWVDPLGRY